METMERALEGIFTLPNEILLSIFCLFQTRDLLEISRTCHRFHSLIVRAVQQRLQVAGRLDGHALYLRCYRPAAKWTTSGFFCLPLGTNNMPELVSDIQENGGRIGHLEIMNNLYSRFRPVNHVPDFRLAPDPSPAGDVLGSRIYMSDQDAAAAWERSTEEAVTRSIHIDASFLFAQLETTAYLCRRDSTRGLFSVRKFGGGTIRVWRHWLSKLCQAKRFTDGELITIQHDDSATSNGMRKARSDSLSSVTDVKKDPAILWLNTGGENIGIRFQVREQMWRRDQPILFSDESEVPVSYKVELQEILVRTTHLLLELEEPRQNPGGNTLFVGSFKQDIAAAT